MGCPPDIMILKPASLTSLPLCSPKSPKYNNYDEAKLIVSSYPNFPKEKLFIKPFFCPQTKPIPYLFLINIATSTFKVYLLQRLTRSLADLKEPYNQGFKEQVTTNYILKKAALFEIPNPNVVCRGCF